MGILANILVNDMRCISPPMPLDVDNGLPGLQFWFGTEASNEVGFIYHMDTCAAMNTKNLTVHKWVITNHPHFVAEYIQYDNIRFKPLQFHCTVEDLELGAWSLEKDRVYAHAINRYALHAN